MSKTEDTSTIATSTDMNEVLVHVRISVMGKLLRLSLDPSTKVEFIKALLLNNQELKIKEFFKEDDPRWFSISFDPSGKVLNDLDTLSTYLDKPTENEDDACQLMLQCDNEILYGEHPIKVRVHIPHIGRNVILRIDPTLKMEMFQELILSNVKLNIQRYTEEGLVYNFYLRHKGDRIQYRDQSIDLLGVEDGGELILERELFYSDSALVEEIINVIIQVPMLDESMELAIDSSINIKKTIQERVLIHFELPIYDLDGTPHRYFMVSKRLNKVLTGSLKNSGVQDGDSVIFYQEGDSRSYLPHEEGIELSQQEKESLSSN